MRNRRSDRNEDKPQSSQGVESLPVKQHPLRLWKSVAGWRALGSFWFHAVVPTFCLVHRKPQRVDTAYFVMRSILEGPCSHTLFFQFVDLCHVTNYHTWVAYGLAFDHQPLNKTFVAKVFSSRYVVGDSFWAVTFLCLMWGIYSVTCAFRVRVAIIRAPTTMWFCCCFSIRACFAVKRSDYEESANSTLLFAHTNAWFDHIRRAFVKFIDPTRLVKWRATIGTSTRQHNTVITAFGN